MDYKIIVDSCCDMTRGLKEKLGIIAIPFTMTLGSKIFTDDESLNLPNFIEEMKNCTSKAGSASPSPQLYKEAFEGTHTSFAVTLSSNLSGSYGSAMLGKTLADEEESADVYVFDSKSASAGEVLVAVKIWELLLKGMSKDRIIKTVNQFIDNMKTYFVLERYDNLQKNGRLNKISGKLINVLNIKLVMGSDGDGNIALHAKTRGIPKTIDKLISFIKDSGKATENENLVISHCNNLKLVEQLVAAIKQQFQFKEIYILPTGGLSSLYADDKGIILAF